ncbi:Hr-like lesion-inducing protein-like protein [Thalictrum thalictroides]|uniref:Hr-like lesion-inducing protein-like protein n=1 Tax=Thalictrum thalictroides TaxID=46969 RepID=A0A7J6X1S1_THATH|nr:Hr-like lesion-inducing protein-like protein [Thalictrum thalictroides]
MGFTSFAGRVLFASVFIISAWQQFNEFGVDGGPSAKALKPKFHVVTNHVSSIFGVEVPEIEIKHIVAAAIAFKGIGGILFIFGSSLGAYLLLLHQIAASPILYDLYTNGIDKDDFVEHVLKHFQSLAVLGALLIFLGMKNSIPKRQAKKKAPKTKTV